MLPTHIRSGVSGVTPPQTVSRESTRQGRVMPSAADRQRGERPTETDGPCPARTGTSRRPDGCSAEGWSQGLAARQEGASKGGRGPSACLTPRPRAPIPRSSAARRFKSTDLITVLASRLTCGTRHHDRSPDKNMACPKAATSGGACRDWAATCWYRETASRR